ncbi:MAG: hypothetical protein V1798_10515, partial [Pseudomonadota bacterium]
MKTRLVLIVLFLALLPLRIYGQAIIADHNAVSEFNQIPANYIEQAKNAYRILYGHTSHGSQITSGMSVLMSSNNLYRYHRDSSVIPGSLSYVETSPDAG